MYIKFTPSKVRASLRSLANGHEPLIPAWLLADHLLHEGASTIKHRDAPKDDFVRFAERLFTLNDSRQPGAEGQEC